MPEVGDKIALEPMTEQDKYRHMRANILDPILWQVWTYCNDNGLIVREPSVESFDLVEPDKEAEYAKGYIVVPFGIEV